MADNAGGDSAGASRGGFGRGGSRGGSRGRGRGRGNRGRGGGLCQFLLNFYFLKSFFNVRFIKWLF